MEDSTSSTLRLRIKSGSVTADANPTSVTMTEAKFDIVLDDRVKQEPIPVPTFCSKYFPIVSWWNQVFYLSALFLNIFACWAQGQDLGGLFYPLVYGIAAVFDNCKQSTLCHMLC